MKHRPERQDSEDGIIFTFLQSPTGDQIQQLIGLYHKAGWWKEAADSPQFVERFIRGSHCFMIVLNGNEIIGMGRALSDGVSDAYLQDITVKEQYQHERIGSRIVEQLVARLHRDGLFWIGLIAERDSHGFYRGLGFEEIPNSMPMLHKQP